MRCPASLRSRVPARAAALACFRTCGLTRFPDAVRGALVAPESLALDCTVAVGFAAGGTDSFVDCLAVVLAILESSEPFIVRNSRPRRWCATGHARNRHRGRRTSFAGSS